MKNLFFYSATNGEFVKSVSNGRVQKDIINKMKVASVEAGVTCGDSEINSWSENINALSELLTKSNLPDDVYVGLEYQVPVGGRIDCVLFGKDTDGRKNMLHIELKQWSNDKVSTYYSGYSFEVVVDGYKSGTKITSHPSAQADEYQNHLRNYIAAFDEKNINLYGFAYCYNYEAGKDDNVLCNESFKAVTSRCPLYCKDQTKAFAARLHDLLEGGNGDEVCQDILKSEVRPTKSLQDAAKNMFDGKCASEEFSLVGEQLDAYNSILGAIKNTDKKDEKTVVVVKGGPGTGKSVIAMRLISGLAKTGKFRNIFYSTRSTSLIKGYTDLLKNISYADGSDCNAIDLLLKNVKIKPHYNDDCKGESWIDALVVDEAHRIEKWSNDQNDKEKRNQTHLSQIMNMIFTSRVSIFFIDDFQSVKKSEIGTSENIKKAALGYYEKIIAENEAYLNGYKGAYHDGIPKVENDFKRAEESYQKILNSGDYEKIRKAKNKLKSLKGELELAKKWVQDATPSNVKVNYIEFELEDQFRCNGSKNYIDWIEHVLYNTPRTKDVKLDHSKYKFEVFDSPSLMYKKVREMDDFGRFADEMMRNGNSYDDVQIAAKNKEFKQRARLLAGWCWPWKQKTLDTNGEDLLHEIIIPENDGSLFSIPWETLKEGKKPIGKYRKMYAASADVWLNDNNGINQTGCIHSAQGWEVDYVGVIIAGDIKYDPVNDCLCCNDAVKNEDREVPKTGADRDRITKNIYRVLMTRGKKGCFVFACDPAVRDYLKRCLENS